MPEPLSIATGVVSIVSNSIKGIQTLYGYASTYANADLDIAALLNECSTVRLALLQIQDLRLRSCLWSQIDSNDAISAAIIEDYDNVLGSCQLVFSLLQERLKKFNLEALNKVDKAAAWSKLKYTWTEQGIEKLQSNIHGLVGGLNLLLTALQSDTISRTHEILRSQENASIIKLVVDDAHTLRSARPEESMWMNISAAERAGSVLGDEEFDFDGPLINTKAYRRVMAAKERRLHNESKADKGKVKEVQQDQADLDEAISRPLPASDNSTSSFILAGVTFTDVSRQNNDLTMPNPNDPDRWSRLRQMATQRFVNGSRGGPVTTKPPPPSLGFTERAAALRYRTRKLHRSVPTSQG